VGTAVYLNTSQSSQSGVFSVSIDNSEAYQVDGFTNSSDTKCGVSWSSPSLPNGTHTVTIMSMGQSEQATADGQTDASTFELDGITVSNVNTTSAAVRALIANAGHCFLVSLFAILFAII